MIHCCRIASPPKASFAHQTISARGHSILKRLQRPLSTYSDFVKPLALNTPETVPTGDPPISDKAELPAWLAIEYLADAAAEDAAAMKADDPETQPRRAEKVKEAADVSRGSRPGPRAQSQVSWTNSYHPYDSCSGPWKSSIPSGGSTTSFVPSAPSRSCRRFQHRRDPKQRPVLTEFSCSITWCGDRPLFFTFVTGFARMRGFLCRRHRESARRSYRPLTAFLRFGFRLAKTRSR